MDDQQQGREFAFKDCALVAIATGQRAYSLRELRDNLLAVTTDSIYYHFWGGLLQPRFEEREYNNDFAAWVRHSLHDPILAERLAVIDPTEAGDLDTLRQELADLMDERLDESEYLHWVRASYRFEFIRSQIVVFDTGRRISRPDELLPAVRELSTGSVFYHFIDAHRRLPERCDDLSLWLSAFGEPCSEMCQRLKGVDPYFGSLSELREQLVELFETYLPKEVS